MAPDEHDFHRRYIKKAFGTKEKPVIPYTGTNINDLARDLVLQQTAVTGAQPKLSMHLSKPSTREAHRLTLVGVDGGYILKPQTKAFPNLPENEDLTMHLAAIAGIKVVPHTLARMADGELCYITQRIDRTPNGQKIAMEDACQLSQRLTADKYRSSYEQVAKVISQYSNVGKLDLVSYWEIVLFSWLVGNSDMHLKNISLYMPTARHWQLTPAYDLLSVRIAMPADREELALTLNGKRNNIKHSDFIAAMEKSAIDASMVSRMIKRFAKLLPQWNECICASFLPPEQQYAYMNYIERQLAKVLE